MPLISASRILLPPLPAAKLSPGTVAQARSLACPIDAQEKTFWCWAAIGVSFARYFKREPLKQCELARMMMGGDCCTAKDCDKPWLLESVLGPLGVDVLDTLYPRPLTFSEVVEEIEDDRPIGVRIALAGGSAHYIAIHGVETTSRILHLADPEPAWGTQQRAYDVLLNSYRGTWTHSFTTRPPP